MYIGKITAAHAPPAKSPILPPEKKPSQGRFSTPDGKTPPFPPFFATFELPEEKTVPGTVFPSAGFFCAARSRFGRLPTPRPPKSLLSFNSTIRPAFNPAQTL
jgi:hypothetical protein